MFRYPDKEKSRHVLIFDRVLNVSRGLRGLILNGDFERDSFADKESAVMRYLFKIVSYFRLFFILY